MKKATSIFGGLASITITIAVLLKYHGIVGGNIFMVFSCGLLVPIFLILKGISMTMVTKSPFPVLVSFFTTLLNIGILFLIQHYVGGMLIYRFSFYILIIVLFTWYFVELFKKQEKRSISLSSISLLILFCTITFGFGNRAINDSVRNGLIQCNTNFEFIDSEITKIGKTNFDNLDTANLQQLNEFNKKTQNLIDNIEALKVELATTANQGNPYSNINEIISITNYDINNVIMFPYGKEGKADELRILADNYYEYCLNLIKGTELQSKINNYIDIKQDFILKDKRANWQMYYFYNMTVISSISNLTAMQVKIRLFENLVYKNSKIK